MPNPSQPKDTSSGKFIKKSEPIVEPKSDIPVDISDISDQEFIMQVRNEIISGYNYIDRIQKAYQKIVGNDSPANMLTMKRTILNHNG